MARPVDDGSGPFHNPFSLRSHPKETVITHRGRGRKTCATTGATEETTTAVEAHVWEELRVCGTATMTGDDAVDE